jgi:hypothetical protein
MSEDWSRPIMTLSPAVGDKLRAWYGPNTWHTSHDFDMNRWYDFVSQYQVVHGFTIDETNLREHIESKIRKRGDTLNDALSDVIRERISLMYHILEFLMQTGRY